MKHNRYLFLAFALVVFTGNAWAQDGATNESEKVVFVDSGLPKGEPSALLPGGWVAALRLTHIERSLSRLDGLIASFMTPELLPGGPASAPGGGPDRLALLKNPLTTALGAQSKFGSISRSNLLKRTGWDLARPVVLAWYPDAGLPKNKARLRKGLILAIPISGDRELAGGFLTGLFDGEELQNETVGGLKGFSMKSPMGERPTGRLTVFFAANYIYVCGSVTTALRLADGGPRFASDAMAKPFSLAGDDDLTAAFSLSFLKKPEYLDPKALEGAVPGLVGELQKRLGGLSPKTRMGYNRALKSFTGIAKLDDVVVLAEILARAALTDVLPEVKKFADSARGFGLSLTTSADIQKISLTYERSETNPKATGSPIPWDAVKAALPSVPGDRNTLVISGRRPAGEGPVLAAKLVARVAEGAKQKGVLWPFLDRLKETLATWRHTPPMDSRWPYAIRFQNTKQAAPINPDPGAAPLEKQWAQTLARWQEPYTTLFPIADISAPEKTLAERASNESANELSLSRLLYGRTGLDYFSGSSRFRGEKPVGRALGLTYEDVTTTQFGLFGYQQHEWVNRQIYFLRPQGNYVFLQQARLPSLWLSGENAPVVTPVDIGLTRLLASAPAGAQTVVIDRRLPEILPLVDDLSAFENILAAEADAFLKTAQKVVDGHSGDDETLQTKLTLLEPPLAVTELLLTEGRKVYCKVLGVPYPRPRAMEAIKELLKDFRAQAQTGGALCALVEGPDRCEISLQQDTRDLALLWTSVVQAFWKKYPGADFDAKWKAFEKSLGDGGRQGKTLLNYGSGFFGTEALSKLLEKPVKKSL